MYGRKKIQIVHIGETLPDYTLASLRLLHRFSNVEAEFIADGKHSGRIPKHLASFYAIEDFYERDRFQAARLNLEAPPGFRNGFWSHALERFFVLAQYQKHQNLGQLFHIEADQVLFRGEELIAQLETGNNEGLYFPMHTSQKGVASIFFANGRQVMENFVDFISRTHAFSNEMIVLSRWAMEFPNEFFPLPTLADIQNPSQWYKQPLSLSPIDGTSPPVVDAAQIGQWIAGVDPRNLNLRDRALNQFSDKPSENLLSRDQLTSLRFVFDQEAILLRCFDGSVEVASVFNLHLHSKLHPWLVQRRARLSKLIDLANGPTRTEIRYSARALRRRRLATRIQSMFGKADKSIRRFRGHLNGALAGLSRQFGWRPPSFPYLSGDGFRAISDVAWEEPPNSVRERLLPTALVIFCEGQLLSDFRERALPQLRKDAILIVGNSDRNFSTNDFEFVGNSRIRAAFVQNLNGGTDKVVALPIGLENAWRRNHGVKSEFDKARRKHSNRAPRIMWTFDLDSNSVARSEIAEQLESLKTADRLKRLTPRKHREALLGYSFVACPPGNGLDTHRVWEAMYLGCVPIVPLNLMNKSFVELGLPIWGVRSFHILSDYGENELAKIYADISRKKNHEAMFFPFWNLKIQESLREISRAT